MNYNDACKILYLTGKEEMTEIKRQYRRLMGRFHPDALGSEHPEHMKKAQLINEAYDFLKKYDRADQNRYNNRKKETSAHTQTKKSPEWQGFVNENAFCERSIYQYYQLDDEEAANMYYQAARGKYIWQPDREEFALFIMSIHHTVKDLLEAVENKRDDQWRMADHSEIKNNRFQLQAQLFQLIAQQFVRPIYTMQKLSAPVTKDKEGRNVWHFRAWIGSKCENHASRAIFQLQIGEVLYPKAFEKNKILVRNKEGKMLGHLSFEDDWVYFCVIPLLKMKKAQVRMIVAGSVSDRKNKNSAARADIDFYIRVEKEFDEAYSSADLNLKISDILTKYEKHLY